MRLPPIVLALTALTACGSSETAPAGNVAASAAPPLVQAAPGLSDPMPETGGMQIAESMPGTFVGRWGLGAADCEAGRADAKGLMTIEPTKLSFYESRATIKAASPTPTDGIELTLAFTGEGQNWEVKTVFELEDHRQTLVRVDRDPPVRLRYTRCPR